MACGIFASTAAPSSTGSPTTTPRSISLRGPSTTAACSSRRPSARPGRVGLGAPVTRPAMEPSGARPLRGGPQVGGRHDHTRPSRSPRVILQMLFFIVVIPFMPLIISGRWGWWGRLGLCGHRHPRLCHQPRAGGPSPPRPAGRARPLYAARGCRAVRQGAGAAGGAGGGLIPVVAGIDALLDGVAVAAAGLADRGAGADPGGVRLWHLGAAGEPLFLGMVRIQRERVGSGRRSSGPDAWVRHPGYAGAILTYLATPILLEALWAFVPVALLTAPGGAHGARGSLAAGAATEGYAECAQRRATGRRRGYGESETGAQPVPGRQHTEPGTARGARLRDVSYSNTI